VNTPHLNPSQTGRYSIYLPRRDGRLSWPTWRYTPSTPRWFTRPRTVIHPNINWGQCRLAMLTEANALTTTLRRHLMCPSPWLCPWDQGVKRTISETLSRTNNNYHHSHHRWLRQMAENKIIINHRVKQLNRFFFLEVDIWVWLIGHPPAWVTLLISKLFLQIENRITNFPLPVPSRHCTQKSAVDWWVQTKRLPGAYTPASASSCTFLLVIQDTPLR